MISAKIPAGFIPGLQVVSCYIEHNSQLLFLQRPPEHKHSSKWGLPAGKLEPGESILRAIIREIKEETGLSVGAPDLSHREALFVSFNDKEFLYHVFHTKLPAKPEIKVNSWEHQHHDWFTVEQALALDLIHDLDACLKRHYQTAEALPNC